MLAIVPFNVMLFSESVKGVMSRNLLGFQTDRFAINRILGQLFDALLRRTSWNIRRPLRSVREKNRRAHCSGSTGIRGIDVARDERRYSPILGSGRPIVS